MSAMKKCSTKVGCGKMKPEDEFYLMATGKRQSVCKECAKRIRREQYQKNKEKALETSKKYYHENKEKVKKLCKAHYEEHREEIIKKALKRYSEKVKKEQGRAVVHTGPNIRTRSLLAKRKTSKKKK
jgi:hypothetical protein